MLHPEHGEGSTAAVHSIRVARSDEEIERCFPAMHQLRPHLRAEEFVVRVRVQQETGFELAYLVFEDSVRAVAGFRVIENLASGRVLYVDDLVTEPLERSRGFGKLLLDWLVERAREGGCDTLELDSGVQRFDAHRFYFTNRMTISSYHFRLALE